MQKIAATARRSIQVVGLCLALAGTMAHAADPPPIPIAAIYAYSGPAVNTNAKSFMGVRHAVEKINRQGGVRERRLKLLEFDNRSTPIGAKVAAEKAAAAGAMAIVGCAWSSHSMAAARVAQARGIPMISNVSTHPDLTGIGPFIFRTCFDDRFQGEVMAGFAAKEQNRRRAVVFVDLTSDYSMGLARAFHDRFEALGGRVLKMQPYKHRQNGFQETVAAIVRFRPDVLFIPGHDESGMIAREAGRAGLAALILGSDGWDVPSTFALGGDALENAFFCTHWAEGAALPSARAYVENHPNKGSIYAAEALAHDAVFLLADAMARARAMDRDSIRNALAATRHFSGVTGNISFDSNGDPIKGAVIMRVRNGRPGYFSTVGPMDVPAPAGRRGD